MTTVIVEPDESFENALKRFNSDRSPDFSHCFLRKRPHYEKPSVKRKRKTLAARKKAERRQRMSE